MDAERFDALSRALTTTGSRRTTLGALLGALLGSALLGLSPDAFAAAGKGRVKTKHGHAGAKKDRRPVRGAGAEGRRTQHEKNRHEALIQDSTDTQLDTATDELTAEPADEMVVSKRSTKRRERDAAVQLKSGAAHPSDLSAAACLPPGAKPCTQASDCCSGRCKRKKQKCLACPKGTAYCAAKAACVVSSQCVVTCETGFADCDGDGSCETDITTSTQHCGGCNNPCGSNQTCVNKVCTSTTTCPTCVGDKVCNTSTGFCTCPVDKPNQCEFNSQLCSADPNTDSKRCGLNCYDCEASFAAGYRCCNGQCVNGCGPSSQGDCQQQPCGPNCQPCTAPKVCCNLGVGTSSQCVDPVAGYCPSLAT